MAVRPFYMTAEIEGRNTDLSGGPRNKNGEMNIKIQQRNKGEIETVLNISSHAVERDGKLMLRTVIYDASGKSIFIHETEY